MVGDEYLIKIREHYESCWSGTPSILRWEKGPISELPQQFSVLKFEPSNLRAMWTYASCGMSIPSDLSPLELHMFSSQESGEALELLTVVSHYNRTGNRLGLGHTVNFGRSWLPSSNCEFGLISLPYLDGPGLECLDLNGINVRFLWLIPVTREEVEFKKKHGLVALEENFETASFDYLDINRLSVV